MSSRLDIVLVDPDSALVDAWREVFRDRPEVGISLDNPWDLEVDAHVFATRNGALPEAVQASYGEPVEAALKDQIRTRFGGALPVDHAICIPTPKGPSPWLIAVSGARSNPDGVDDALRVALSAGAALQAAQSQNAEEPASIGRLALPRLGPATVGARARAELMWTAYALSRQAELPDFATMRRALTALLMDADRDGPAGSLKRSFDTGGSSSKATIPDRAAAAAQRRRQGPGLDD